MIQNLRQHSDTNEGMEGDYSTQSHSFSINNFDSYHARQLSESVSESVNDSVSQSVRR